MTRVTVIYATTAAMAPVQRELDAFPDLDVLTVLDEALLRCATEDGSVTGRSRARMADHLRLAAEAGSEAALVTCNIYSHVLPELREEVHGLEVLAIDGPMVDLAVSRFRRAAVVATTPAGLEVELDLLRTAASERGVEFELEPILCDAASAALAAGDASRHDELIVEAITSLRDDLDGVVLAQASMARVLSMLPPQARPVLASPRLAVEELHRRTLSRGVASC